MQPTSPSTARTRIERRFEPDAVRRPKEAVREGKISYVGSSNFAAWDVALAQCAASGRHFLGLVSEQSHYSLPVRAVEFELIPALRHLRSGLIPYSPLRMGLLAGALGNLAVGRGVNDSLLPLVEAHPDQLRAYESLCHELGATPVEVALAWLVANPAVVSAVIGAVTPEELLSSLRAMSVHLDPGVLARLDEIWPGPGEAPQACAW